MAIFGSKSTSGVSLRLFIGGFICLSVSFLVIASTIVLSLISLYIPNHSKEGYGERKYNKFKIVL